MGEKTVLISLTQEELFGLEGIIIDGDKDEALRYLRETIKAKADAATTGHCRPPMDWGGKPPS